MTKDIFPMWYVYILKCSDNSLYTGITTDLDNRINQHNKGIASKYTLPRRPVKCIYLEKCPNRSSATKREREIKSWDKQKKLSLAMTNPK